MLGKKTTTATILAVPKTNNTYLIWSLWYFCEYFCFLFRVQKALPYFWFLIFYINHILISTGTKTVKSYAFSATNLKIFPENLKRHQQHFPWIAGNNSTALPASLFRVSARLSDHFFQSPLSFDEDEAEAAEFPPLKRHL